MYVLERESDFGGHSRSDIGGINLVNTISQRVRGNVVMTHWFVFSTEEVNVDKVFNIVEKELKTTPPNLPKT